MFRESVLECMAKALGLSESGAQMPRVGPSSVEQSPRLVSYDAKSQTAIFNNAFGLLMRTKARLTATLSLSQRQRTALERSYMAGP